MRYLEHANRIDCNNQEGIRIVNRICLNLELQKIDSFMVSRYDMLLKKLDDRMSFKHKLETHQNNWEQERKDISTLKSDGLTGNSEGISYLHSMVTLTKLRIKELEFILDTL